MPADLGRERIGMMFIDIDASRACTTRSASSRLVHGREVTGGKVGKVGNLTPTRPGQVCSPNSSPYSGTKEFPVAAAAAPAQYRVVFLWIGPIS
jgi:hypothetical protein